MDPKIFVTEDKWIREHGKLDDADKAAMKEVCQKGQLVIVMNIKEMIEAIYEKEPEKYQEFKKIYEKQAGVVLTKDKLIEYCSAPNGHLKAFEGIFKGMSKEQARQIRTWRIEEHYSWRAVARAAYMKVRKEKSWRCFAQWDPPSNKIAGMALCDQAAKMSGEDYRKDPWN